jgi:hypothetical protein
MPSGKAWSAPPRPYAASTAAWIKDQRVRLKDGKTEEYQVDLRITFVLEG